MARESEFLALGDLALRAVIGPGSRHLALIEDRFKVLVETPGGGVSINGSARDRAQAKRVIETLADRADTGLALERQIFGRETVDNFFASAPADQLHLQQHVAAHAFGDNLSRSGLDTRMRELISLTMLVTLGG
jgi:phosphate starvation-inducible protein PhoH